MKWKCAIFLIVLSPGVAGVLDALPPSLVLGAYAEGGDSSLAPSLGTPYSDARIQGIFGWRQALAPGSYLAITSQAAFAPYLTWVQGYVDGEILNLELGLPAPGGTVILDAGADNSFVNQTGVGSYGQPAWSAEYRRARDAGGLQPSLSYLGSYLYETAGADDHLSETLRLKVDRSTSVRLDTYAALKGGWELWTEQQAFDGSGVATGSQRQDWVVDLSAGARGFAGFALDWSADASAGVRFSDASTSSTAVSQLVLPGGSRLTAAAKSSGSWTPNRYLSLTLSANLQEDWYFERYGLNADGTTGDSRLSVFSAGGGLKVDWTPDNVFYIVIQANVSRSFANDPGVAEWGGVLSTGVEYAF